MRKIFLAVGLGAFLVSASVLGLSLSAAPAQACMHCNAQNQCYSGGGDGYYACTQGPKGCVLTQPGCVGFW